MRKIALMILTVLTVQVFPAIEFICYENGVNQACTERKNVSLSSFDSSITTALNSNWYYTDQSGTSTIKYAMHFWDDEIWEDTRQKYEGFSAIDNNFGDSSNMGVTEGIAMYQNMDATLTTNTATSFAANAEMILTIYAFVGDTKLELFNAGGEFSLSKTGTNLSSIKFGTTDNKCLFSQTGQENANNEFEFGLTFTTCPITITAVDPDTNTSYQFTSNFDGLSKSFTCGSVDEDKGDKGAVERELLNSDGNQVGYLIFDFFTNKFQVVDLDKQPFSAN